MCDQSRSNYWNSSQSRFQISQLKFNVPCDTQEFSLLPFKHARYKSNFNHDEIAIAENEEKQKKNKQLRHTLESESTSDCVKQVVDIRGKKSIRKMKWKENCDNICLMQRHTTHLIEWWSVMCETISLRSNLSR